MVRRSMLATLVLAALLTVVGGAPAARGGTPAHAQACSVAYPDFCIAPSPDVNCPDLLPAVNFTALPPDPQGLDADNDEIACEDPSRPRFTTSTTSVSTIPSSTTSTTVSAAGSGSPGLSSANSGAGSDASGTGTAAMGGAGGTGTSGGGSGSTGIRAPGGSRGSGTTSGGGSGGSTAPAAMATTGRTLALTG